MQATCDYIIIGSGSAGGVLANRLSEDGDARVLVLEAGPRDRSLFIHMPAAFAWPLKDDKYNWYYQSEPEPHMNGRRMYCPRGRVLGGSSSINGMAYVRGHALDYDRWAGNALPGWSYAHVLPYFKRAESRAKGGDAYRGANGPLHVSTGACTNALHRAFIEAGVQAGYPFTEDMNGYQQEGFGAMDMTTHKGRRWSTAQAYLKPALARPNLSLELRALVSRILFEGDRAVGVEYAKAGKLHTVRAEREVLLCGGAINSPQLLMLSGVGDADDLRALGIAVRVHLPGVGRNLQDHLEIYVQQACTQPISLYGATRPWNQLRIGLQWLLFGEGPGATNHFESGAFIRRHAGVRHPDLQYHFLPIAVSYDGRAAAEGHGYQAHVGPMRATSRGRVALRSADPRQGPSILFNYMATESDREEMRDAVRLTREIFAQPAFDPFRGAELAPGPAVQSDADIDAFVRAKGESAYHPSCTCRMGSDALAVVDEETRVHGLEGLRVVDASIMPSIVSGNLNAPTIMVAEKAADMIKGLRLQAPVVRLVVKPRKARGRGLLFEGGASAVRSGCQT
jgi:choline dehydrogenase